MSFLTCVQNWAIWVNIIVIIIIILQVYLLTPVYMRFGGSVVRTLVSWKEAPEMDLSDNSYYVAPPPLEPQKKAESMDFSSYLCPYHQQDCYFMYYQQFVKGNSSMPVGLTFWAEHQDPRFVEVLWGCLVDFIIYYFRFKSIAQKG